MSQSQIVITLQPLVVRNQTELTSKHNKEQHAAASGDWTSVRTWTRCRASLRLGVITSVQDEESGTADK